MGTETSRLAAVRRNSHVVTCGCALYAGAKRAEKILPKQLTNRNSKIKRARTAAPVGSQILGPAPRPRKRKFSFRPAADRTIFVVGVVSHHAPLIALCARRHFEAERPPRSQSHNIRCQRCPIATWASIGAARPSPTR